MTSRIGSNGFTLIEVLVASVILFAGLGAVLKAYSLAAVAMESASDKLAVCQVMQEKAAELELQVAGPGDALPSGEERQRVNDREYLWKVRASKQALTPEVSVVKAAIEVSRANQPAMLTCIWEWTQFQKKGP